MWGERERERESQPHSHSTRNSYPGLKLINNGPHISDGFFQLKSADSGSTFFAFIVDSLSHYILSITTSRDISNMNSRSH